MSKAQRVAIVHDWLVGGGAERVVQALHELYPDAPIYTSYATKEWRDKLDCRVVTGWLQHLGPFRKFIPFLRIWWFTSLNFDDYDLVISSSGNGEAKGIKTSDDTMHVCYCHAPTHFYWRHYDQYLKEPGFGLLNPLARLGLRLLVSPLRKWDLKASQRPDYFIANSSHTASEIQQFYGRDAVVVHPPVDTDRFRDVKQPKQRSGFITVGRLVPYKRVDLIIEACNELGAELKVVGRGPELSKLQSIAGPTISFHTDVSDADMPAMMASAEAFIFAAYEDFGITPVEAMACGTPVIAYRNGGALDYVTEGVTGCFFDAQSSEALAKALSDFQPSQFSATSIQAKAESFSSSKFKQTMTKTLQHLRD